MKKNNTIKALFISCLIYCILDLFGIISQFLSLGSLSADSILMLLYLISLILKPISLIFISIYICKMLSILLKAAFIIIDNNEK